MIILVSKFAFTFNLCRYVMELNAQIVTAREDHACANARNLRRGARFGRAGLDSDVTFDMLTEELWLCVGGVLENVSRDKDNRTRWGCTS